MQGPDPSSRILLRGTYGQINVYARRHIKEMVLAGYVGAAKKSPQSLWEYIQRGYIRLDPPWGEELFGADVEVPGSRRTCREYHYDYTRGGGDKGTVAIRDVSLDSYIVHQCGRPNLYALMNAKGKRVLDLGAHIGCYSRLALGQGAKFVVAVEPDPDTVPILRYNLREAVGDGRARVMAVAAVAHKPVMPVYLSSPYANTAAASIVFDRQEGRKSKVLALHLENLYNLAKPEVLKVDVEGMEFELLNGEVPIPDSVEQIAIEFSLGKSRASDGKTWTKKSHELAALFDDWKCLKKPNLAGGSITEGVWSR